MASADVCSSRDWQAVRQPSPSSHKGENGRLLILSGSKQYHGSLILAIEAAVRFCDLVYVHSSPENKGLVKKIKAASANLIYLDAKALPSFFSKMDAFCVGPGWAATPSNKRLLANVLKTKKPAVLDATALSMLDAAARRLLHPRVVLTPHRGEFSALFGMPANAQTVQSMAKKHRCIILCKGPVDYIASPSTLAVNNTHHAGMTKGGTGDVLAGLTAALMASHTAPLLAARAAAYLNGYAGVRLSRRMGSHYSSEDLVCELPLAAHELEESSPL